MKWLVWLVILCLLAGCVSAAAAERLDDSILQKYYDDSAFFGDSRMQALQRYRKAVQQTDETYLANIKLVCAESISLYAASRSYISGYCFSYRGAEGTLYDIAARVEAKKVFVMAGLNDPVGEKPEKALVWVVKVIDTLQKRIPGVDVCFFSETPVTQFYEKTKNRPTYQQQLDEYNKLLKETCESHGARYMDLTGAFKNEDNYLKSELSSDKVCHLSEEGAKVWVQVLLDYAQEQYDLGLWDPFSEPESEPEPEPETNE